MVGSSGWTTSTTSFSRPAQQRRQAQDLAGRELVEARIVRLRLDDGVEVAAIGDVDHQLAQLRAVDPHLAQRQVRLDVGEPHPLDEPPHLLVLGHHPPRRRVEVEPARLARAHQPLLQRHGDGADRAVPAHRQAARHLDEQHADVAVRRGRRVEDRARHHVVPARLEHQGGADPVVIGRGSPAASRSCVAPREQRPAAGDQPHRAAAGVAVDAEEGLAIGSEWLEPVVIV